MKLFKYLKTLLGQEYKDKNADENLMNAPFWGGFYDRSQTDKKLINKKKK